MVHKRKMKKSLLSAALVMALIFSFVPMALAADAIVVTTGEELDAAIKSATGDSSVTITVANNIDAVVSATYTGYSTGSSITIDGQGFTINGNDTMDTGLRFGARGQEVNLNIINTVFTGMQNDDRNGGGAVALWRGAANVSGSTFTNNVSATGSRGGGGIMVQSGSANIIDSTFTGNRANGNGGAVFAGSGRLENVTVTGNHSITGVGGVNGAFTLIRSIIEDNTTDSETANPNVSANVVYATNALGLTIDSDVSGFGIAGVSLIANLALDKSNLIEATIKYSPVQVAVEGAVAVDGATIRLFEVDPVNGIIKIVVGVAGLEAIANNGPASIADILLKSICKDDKSIIAVTDYAVYSAGEVVTGVSLSPDTISAGFVYADKYDVNNDGILDARDLSLALYRFGAASADDNWDTVKSADISGDGIVDILDISTIVDALYA